MPSLIDKATLTFFLILIIQPSLASLPQAVCRDRLHHTEILSAIDSLRGQSRDIEHSLTELFESIGLSDSHPERDLLIREVVSID